VRWTRIEEVVIMDWLIRRNEPGSPNYFQRELSSQSCPVPSPQFFEALAHVFTPTNSARMQFSQSTLWSLSGDDRRQIIQHLKFSPHLHCGHWPIFRSRHSLRCNQASVTMRLCAGQSRAEFALLAHPAPHVGQRIACTCLRVGLLAFMGVDDAVIGRRRMVNLAQKLGIVVARFRRVYGCLESHGLAGWSLRVAIAFVIVVLFFAVVFLFVLFLVGFLPQADDIGVYQPIRSF
jgi:hypothetical protein